MQVSPRRESPVVWWVGALAAVALHAGGLVVAYAHLPSEDVEAADGAAVTEVSLAFEAPQIEEDANLPPGPRSDASAAATAAVEQDQRAEQTPEPSERPDEADDPERVVAQEAVKPPSEKTPETSQARSHASAESVAAEASAEPRLAAPKEARAAVAPVQGAGASAIRVRTTWQKRLVAHLDRNKRYPDASQPRSVELTVSFTLDRVGHVVATRILKSSGARAYDEAALAMLRRADPVPAPPPLVADDGLTFTLPVIFNARK